MLKDNRSTFLRVGENDTGYSELLEAGDSRKGVVGWHCALPAEMRKSHPQWQRRTKFFGFSVLGLLFTVSLYKLFSCACACALDACPWDPGTVVLVVFRYYFSTSNMYQD